MWPMWLGRRATEAIAIEPKGAHGQIRDSRHLFIYFDRYRCEKKKKTCNYRRKDVRVHCLLIYVDTLSFFAV